MMNSEKQATNGESELEETKHKVISVACMESATAWLDDVTLAIGKTYSKMMCLDVTDLKGEIYMNYPRIYDCS